MKIPVIGTIDAATGDITPDQIIASAAAKTADLTKNEERWLFITLPTQHGHADSVDMEMFIATIWAADSVQTQDLRDVQAEFYQWLDTRR